MGFLTYLFLFCVFCDFFLLLEPYFFLCFAPGLGVLISHVFSLFFLFVELIGNGFSLFAQNILEDAARLIGPWWYLNHVAVIIDVVHPVSNLLCSAIQAFLGVHRNIGPLFFLVGPNKFAVFLPIFPGLVSQILLVACQTRLQFFHKPRVAKVLCLEVLPPLAFGGDLLEAWGVLLLAVNSHGFCETLMTRRGGGAQYGVL